MKLPGLIGGATDAASKLEQSVGGIQSIFKDAAGPILDFGKVSAEQAGLSQRAFNELAGPLGAMLKNSGMSMDKLGDNTIALTKRAADMAATFGGPVDQALGAITAALRGETDPIERYGVSISAARVEAEALAKSGKKTASQLTDQEKATARLALIFKQTADAEGQFARESDSLAGKQEIQKARMENLSASIGTKLMPAMVAFKELQLTVLDFVSAKVIPVFSQYADIVQEKLAAAWQTAQPYVQQALDFLQGTVVPFLQENVPVALQKLGSFVQSEFAKFRQYYESDIKPALENIRAGAEAVVNWIVTNWPKISAVVSPVLAEIQNRVQLVVAVISTALGVIIDLIGGDFSGAWTRLKDLVATVWASIQTSVANALELLKQLAPVALQVGDILMNALWDGLLAVWEEMKKWIPKIPGAMVELMGDVTETLLKVGEAIMQGLWNGMKSKWEDVKGWVSGIPGSIEDTFKSALGIRSPSTVMYDIGVNTALGFINGLQSQKPADAIAMLKGEIEAATEGFNAFRAGGPVSQDWLNMYGATARAGGMPRTLDMLQGEAEAAAEGLAAFNRGLPVSQDWLNTYGRGLQRATSAQSDMTSVVQNAGAALSTFAGSVQTVASTFAQQMGWGTPAPNIPLTPQQENPGQTFGGGIRGGDPVVRALLDSLMTDAWRGPQRFRYAFPAIGPARDSGGPVSAGVPYAIGRGAQPELFVPDRPGQMYPAGSWPRGGGGITVIVQGSVITSRELVGEIRDALGSGAGRGFL